MFPFCFILCMLNISIQKLNNDTVYTYYSKQNNNKTIQDKASSRANFLLKTTAFFIKKKKFLSDLSKWSLKKRKKINSFKQKKPHVFVFHSSTYTVTNEIFQKEKKNDQHWLGYLFPSVQLTFDSDYWCGIVVSSNKHDDLIFIYAFLLKSHLFLLLFFSQVILNNR